MNNDSRTHYIRLTKQGFENLPVKQAFLDRRPLVKIEVDPENNVEQELYTEADGLTFEQAMRLYAPHTVALLQEQENAKPLHLGILKDHDPLPVDMTHAFFGLPNLSPFEIAAIVAQAAEIGVPINEVLIPWGTQAMTYITTGALPD